MHKKYIGFLLFGLMAFVQTDTFAASSVRMLGGSGAVPGTAVTPAAPVTGGTGGVIRKSGVSGVGRGSVLPTTVKSKTDVNRLSLVPIGGSKNKATNSTTTTQTANTDSTTGTTSTNVAGASRITSTTTNTSLKEVTNRIDYLEQQLDYKTTLNTYSDWANKDAVEAVSTEKTDVATTAYVQGAYDDLDASKQDKLNIERGSGAFVTGITAQDGVVTVTTGDITIPSTTGDRVQVWFE